MVIGIATILATMAVVMGAYFGARIVLGSDPDPWTRDLAGSILFRVSALHGLVLALVFASEVVEYHSLSLESRSEVNALSDIYYDSLRYDHPATEELRESVRVYLEVVLNDEWDSLGTSTDLAPAAWDAWEAAYLVTLDLTPETPRQEALRDNMLAKLHVVAEDRDLREHHAKTSLGGLFWFAALAGVVLVSFGYYTFPPKRDNLMLLSIFGAYTGLILFTTFAMSNPYGAPGALRPLPFADLAAELEAASPSLASR